MKRGVKHDVKKDVQKDLAKDLGNSKKGKSKTPAQKSKKALKKSFARMDPQEMVLRQSQYFKTICDPFKYRGVQIPDLTCYPSVPIAITDRRQITVNSNGSCYVVYGLAGQTGALPWGSLVPIQVTTTAHDFISGQTSNASATTPYSPTTDFFPSGGAVVNNLPFTLTNFNSGALAVPSIFQKLRLVSAAATIDYTGTDFDNAGTITSIFLPRNSVVRTNIAAGNAFTIAFAQSLPDSIIVAVNKNSGATVRFRPQDFRSLDYSDMKEIYSDAAVSSFPEESLGGEMYHLVTGATAGKVFQITSIFNFEGIPLLNSAELLAPYQSRSDPLELSSTFNALETVVPVSMGTDQALGAGHPLTQTAPSHGTTSVTSNDLSKSPELSIMDQVLGSGGGGIAGMMGKIGSFAKDLSPLVEGALSLL